MALYVSKQVKNRKCVLFINNFFLNNHKNHDMINYMFKDKTLLIAFLIPTLMIFLTMLSVVLPKFFFNPQNDFILQSGDGYVDKDFYFIKDGKLQVDTQRQMLYEPFNNFGSNSMNTDAAYLEEVKIANALKKLEENVLYYYDVTEGEAREISLEDAQKLKLADDKEMNGYYVDTAGMNYAPYLLAGLGRGGSGRPTLNNKYFSKNIEIGPFTRSYQSIYFIGWVLK